MFKRTLKNGFRVMRMNWASNMDTDIINDAAGEGEKMSFFAACHCGMLTLYMITGSQRVCGDITATR